MTSRNDEGEGKLLWFVVIPSLERRVGDVWARRLGWRPEVMSIYSVPWLRSMGKCQGKRHSRLRLGVIKAFVCKRSKKFCCALSCSRDSEARWKKSIKIWHVAPHSHTANRRKLISKAMRWLKHVFYRTFREGETDSARHLHLFGLEHVFECWLSTIRGFVSWWRLSNGYPRLIDLSPRFIFRCTPDHLVSTTVCTPE